jgi:hypothetical protein
LFLIGLDSAALVCMKIIQMELNSNHEDKLEMQFNNHVTVESLKEFNMAVLSPQQARFSVVSLVRKHRDPPEMGIDHQDSSVMPKSRY